VIIPIGHDQAIRRLPWITIAIIAICTLIQGYASTASDGDAAVLRLGYATGSGLGLSLITSAFVHAGWLHLIGNMLFLFLAGSTLEDRWGAVRYLAFYLAGAAVATLVFDWMHGGEPTVLVGASGAIAATMGAFLVFFGRAQIRFWYWFFRSTGTFHMAAYYALPLWLIEQFVLSKLDSDDGVAYGSHIGGFAFGVAVALVVRLVSPAAARESDAAPEPDAAPRPDARRARSNPAAVPAPVRRAPLPVDPGPVRTAPLPPPITVARPTTAGDAPVRPDDNAEQPKLLR
jgi:membrane associated rhomboid family serine protease